MPTQALTAPSKHTDSVHFGEGCAARWQRVAHGFLGPTTIPHSPTNVQSGRGIQSDASTHTPRARGTHTPKACMANRYGRTPYATRRSPRWLVSVWCSVGVRVMLVALERFCGAHLSAIGPPRNTRPFVEPCEKLSSSTQFVLLYPPLS